MMLIESESKKQVLWFLLSFILLALCRTPAFAQPVSSAQLIDNAQRYDGKTVVYAGEVIGDIMARAEFAWVNIHDGQHAIGVWLPKKLSATILYLGSYKVKGDWVEVSGIFHQACKEHAGELDIHATSLHRIHPGYFVPRIFNRGRMKKAGILLAILGCVWILRHLIKT